MRCPHAVNKRRVTATRVPADRAGLHRANQNFARLVSASMLEAPVVTQNILKFIQLADQDHYDRLRSLCE